MLISVLVVGLCWASRIVCSKRRSERFLEDLEQWRSDLMQDQPEFSFPIEYEHIDPSWSPSNRIIWNPITCKQAGIQLKVRKLVFGEEDGDGNKVYQMEDEESGELFAYKIFGNSHDLMSELAFYMQAGHNQSLLKPICVQRPDRYARKMQGGLVMSWFDGVNAQTYANSRRVSEDDLSRLSKRVLEAIVYVHSLGWTHNDLKTGNVLVNKETGEIKLIDFGFAAPVNAIQPNRGNARIISPELAGLTRGTLGFGADWWAFGAFLAAIHGSKFSDLSERCSGKYSPMIADHTSGEYSICPVPFQEFPPELRKVIYVCSHPSPALRSFSKPSNLALLRSLPYFA